jgi:hypothetical protein
MRVLIANFRMQIENLNSEINSLKSKGSHYFMSA